MRCGAWRARPRRSGVTVCLENLCPVYPGRSSVCHDPLSVRDLVRRLDSRAYAMLLDVGHANVVAGFMGVESWPRWSSRCSTPCACSTCTTTSARASAARAGPRSIPLQLDLHLPPGGGNVPWDQLRPALLAHDAPLMMEIHPAHRSAPSGLLGGGGVRASAAASPRRNSFRSAR